jgi:hypothetical protein
MNWSQLEKKATKKEITKSQNQKLNPLSWMQTNF